MGRFSRPLLAGAFAAALSIVSVHAQSAPATSSYYFGTWAGAASRGTADGAGSVARFADPSALATDAAGNLYVADTANHTVRLISPAGVVSTLAGSPGVPGRNDGAGSTALLDQPRALVLHSDGNLYVGEATGLSRVTREGRVTGVVGTTAFPGGIFAVASESASALWVADSSRIARVTLEGEATFLFNSTDLWPGSTVAVIGALACDAAGNLYVALNGSVPISGQTAGRSQTRVYRIAPNRAVTIVADETNGLAGVGHINGLVLDNQGALYAAASSCAIFRISSGQISVYAGVSGTVGTRDGAAAQALFTNPSGVAFDAGGNLYVSEDSNTIRRITSAGVVSTMAGVSAEDSARYLDGRGTAARFNGPAAIAVTSAGVAYVADRLNHVIRRIAADGTVTTLAGAPGQSGYVDGPASQARFNGPRDLALDEAGNLYVIEESGGVRKISPGGEVSTLAGGAAMGSTPAPDGQGSAAKFGVLTSIAVSPQGEVYVAEAAGYSMSQGSVWARLRRISPAGAVSTIWSLPVGPHTYLSSLVFDRAGVLYAADPIYGSIIKLSPQGTSEVSRVDGFYPQHLAIDGSGNLFMTEDRATGATRVARYSASGQLEVIGGARYVFVHHDAVGTRARFYGLTGIAVDGAGALYLTDEDNTVRKAVSATLPTIVSQPTGQSVMAGAAATFTVSAGAIPEPVYQWYFNGAPIAGAINPTYAIAAASAANAGSYHVVVSNELGSVTSATATLTVAAASGGGNSGGGTVSSGGGGGAPSDFFLVACGALALMRAWSRARTSAQRE